MNEKKPFIERLENVIAELNDDYFDWKIIETSFDAEITKRYTIKALYGHSVCVYSLDTDSKWPMDVKQYVVLPFNYEIRKVGS